MPLREIGDSVTYAIFGKVSEMASRGEQVFPLAIGEPSFPTPKAIVERAFASIEGGDTHYVSPLGIPEVREAIKEKARKHNGINADVPNTIFITTKFAVYASVMVAINGGGEVLIPDPGYFYHQPVVLAGAKPVRYQLAKDYSLDLDAVKQKATPRTKAIIVNTPSNPTGKMLTRRELRSLLEFCKERKITVISDESYEDLVYGRENVSIGSLEPEPSRVISAYSLSKSFAMTGWRAGYVVASKENITLINRLIEHTLTCLPPFVQAASAYALTKGWASTRRFRDELMGRRDLIERMMRKIPRLTFNKTEGAFYSFPRFDSKLSSIEFCKRLLAEKKVAVLPGTIFGPHGEKHLRISFAAPRETIVGGMKLLTEFLEELPS